MSGTRGYDERVPFVYHREMSKTSRQRCKARRVCRGRGRYGNIHYQRLITYALLRGRAEGSIEEFVEVGGGMETSFTKDLLHTPSSRAGRKGVDERGEGEAGNSSRPSICLSGDFAFPVS